jgi:predicted nucleotidyltransferase
MLSEADRKAVIECASKYGVTSVIVFGSSLKDKRSNDIDLGVKGIEPRFFFRFYGDLILGLSKPVDLVDLSKKSRFNRLVEKEGVKIYG